MAQRASARSATPRMVSISACEASDCDGAVARRSSGCARRASARSATPRLGSGAAHDATTGGCGLGLRCLSARSESPGAAHHVRLSFAQVDENERCSCCSKEFFWAAYDVFHAMDRRGIDAVQRADFMWALGALGHGLDFQRTLRRGGVCAYFYGTAKDLYLEEF